MSVDGLEQEDFKKWFVFDSYVQKMQPLIPPYASFKLIDNEEGHPCTHTRVVSDVPLVSPRSFICTMYSTEIGDAFYFITSDRGNEHLVEKHKEIVGEDVIAKYDISLIKFTPKYDASGEVVGTDIIQVVQTNPNGDIPDFVKEMTASYTTKGILEIV